MPNIACYKFTEYCRVIEERLQGEIGQNWYHGAEGTCSKLIHEPDALRGQGQTRGFRLSSFYLGYLRRIHTLHNICYSFFARVAKHCTYHCSPRKKSHMYLPPFNAQNFTYVYQSSIDNVFTPKLYKITTMQQKNQVIARAHKRSTHKPNLSFPFFFTMYSSYSPI